MPRRKAGRLAPAALAALLIAAALPAGAIAAPLWQPLNHLSTAGQDINGHAVAVDSVGDAAVVWDEQVGNEQIVRAASRPAGGVWESPQDVSVRGQAFPAPQVAIDPAGEAVAVWQQLENGIQVVQAASKPAGGPWGSPVTVSAAGREASDPHVAIDGAGEAVAVWTRFDGSDWIAQAASRPADGAWETPIDISITGRSAGQSEIAVDPGGEAVAVWVRSDGSNEIVQAIARTAAGMWGAPMNLSATGKNAGQPEVAIDGAGEATAIWTTQGMVLAATRPAGGSWGTSSALDPGAGDDEPQLAVNATGEAVAVWHHEYSISEKTIQGVTRAADGVWDTTPVDLSAKSSLVFGTEVGIDAAGEAVVTWRRFDPATEANILQGTSTLAGGGWGPPVDLSTPQSFAETASLAVDPGGDALAIWPGFEPGGEFIQAAIHDAAGPNLHALSIPTTGTVGAPVFFSVSPLDAWSAPGPTTWSFGDGATAVGPAASHTYDAPGTYTVSLTSTDALGNASAAEGTVAISVPEPAGQAPVAAASPPGSGGKAEAGRIVKVKAGKALLALACPGPAGCAGIARLSTSAKAKGKADAASARRGRGMVVVGEATFGLAGGGRKTVKVPLTRTGKGLLAAAGRKGLEARLDGSGVVARAVVLKGEGGRPRKAGSPPPSRSAALDHTSHS